MKRNILLIFLAMLPLVGLNAQIIKKSNKDKIAQGIKDGFNDVVDALDQDAHPTGIHRLWDGYVVPKVGVGISSLPGTGGRPEVGFTGGVMFEAFVGKNISINVEINYSHQGANHVFHAEEVPVLGPTGDPIVNAETGEQITTTTAGRYNYNLDYINTSYMFRWYPWSYRPLSVYAGLQMSRLVNAKSRIKGGSNADIRGELHDGEFSIPVGISYEWKQWQFDARYFICPRTLASSHHAKEILGNARNMMLSVTVGYRIQIF